MRKKARGLMAVLTLGALFALPGCSTDEAVKKDAKEAQPTVEQAAKDAEKTGEDVVDKVDDNDSK